MGNHCALAYRNLVQVLNVQDARAAKNHNDTAVHEWPTDAHTPRLTDVDVYVDVDVDVDVDADAALASATPTLDTATTTATATHNHNHNHTSSQ